MSSEAAVTAMHSYLFAQFEDIPNEYVIGGAAALLGLIVLVLALRFVRRRRRVALPPPIPLTIDLAELGDQGPPAASPSLELYNLPVRLAAVILAPSGRGAQLPANLDTPALVDCIVPGLADIVHLHKPLVRDWPAQLSTHGFSLSLFANVPLPGDHGKGTPWTVVAGRFETGQQNLLAGLVVRAAANNSLGQLVAERSGQWLDVLRVRRH